MRVSKKKKCLRGTILIDLHTLSNHRIWKFFKNNLLCVSDWKLVILALLMSTFQMIFNIYIYIAYLIILKKKIMKKEKSMENMFVDLASCQLATNLLSWDHSSLCLSISLFLSPFSLHNPSFFLPLNHADRTRKL